MTAGPLLSDLDGTIADTAPVIFESLRVTCDAMDIELAPDADLSFALGPPLHYVLEHLGVGPGRLGHAIAIFEAAHTERLQLVAPMPGADVVIEELAEAGVAIGVATIKPQPIAERVLRTLGLRDFIGCVRGRDDDLDPRTKTDLLREAASECPGSSPLYVGDHDNDAEAAAALSIPFLRYPDSSWEEIRAAVLATSAEPAPRGADGRGSSAR